MSAPIQPKALVLASKSPQRIELLQKAGYTFESASPALSEAHALHPHLPPSMHAESLAFFKASSVAGAHSDKTILAADTIAILGDQIIGKPGNRDDARRILRRLSGTTHSVCTGVVLLHPAGGRRQLQHAISVIRVRELEDSLIESYLDTGKWCGKAGAYGIQDQDDPFVEKLTGDFTNVVGLPMELLAKMFEQWER